jgi:hypothetical protein
MIDWYYRLGKKQGGPVSTEVLAELTKAGTIVPDTMLWHFGLGDWQKASETPELAAALAAAPAVVPVEERDPTLAGPWSRLWARMIDIYILTYALSFAIFFLSGRYFPWLYIRVVALPDTAFRVIMLPFAFAFLAIVMGVTGTTIGKAIIGIKVENISGRSSWAFYFLRELKVWTLGFWFGIPLLNFLGGAIQAARIAKTGSATYDRDFAIVRRRSSDLQYSLGIFFAVAIVAGGTYSNIVGRTEAVGPPEVRTWVNPATGKQTRFVNAWAAEEWKADAGKLYYFNSDRLLIEALLGYEPLSDSGVDPIAYGEALQAVIAEDIVIESEWKTTTVDGFAAASARGIQPKLADTHVEITVVIMGRSAWRVLLFVRGRSMDDFKEKSIIVRSLLSTAKDINAPTNMPCEGESCLSELSIGASRERS